MSRDDISRCTYDDLAVTLGSPSSSSSPSSSPGDKHPDDDGRARGDPLRGSALVDRDAVRSHVSRYVIRGGGSGDVDGGGAAVDDCIRRVRSFHRSLVFRPPIGDNGGTSTLSSATADEEVGDKIRLSTPSGLRNLGATCYLNSQLQCLSQNLGFVSGLFSWRRRKRRRGGSGTSLDAADERMSNVLSNMQSILARVRYGPDRVLCTNDFASALSLENNEMQDPNEVSSDVMKTMESSFRDNIFFSRPQLLSVPNELWLNSKHKTSSRVCCSTGWPNLSSGRPRLVSDRSRNDRGAAVSGTCYPRCLGAQPIT